MFLKWCQIFPYTTLGHMLFEFNRRPAYSVEFLYMVHGLGGKLRPRKETEIENRISKLEAIIGEQSDGS